MSFTRQFVIDGYDQELPAGDHIVETEQELIFGLSFPVYRRVSTTFYVDQIPGWPGVKEGWRIEPEARRCARSGQTGILD